MNRNSYGGAPKFTTASCCPILLSRTSKRDVVSDLNDAGYPPESWNGSIRILNFAFRCTARSSNAAFQMGFRQAVIEPWHVLGEEAFAGGTSRAVDSSLERLQILANGMVDPRHGCGRAMCLQARAASPDRHGRRICVRRPVSVAHGNRRTVCTRRSKFTRPWYSTSWTRGPADRLAAARIM